MRLGMKIAAGPRPHGHALGGATMAEAKPADCYNQRRRQLSLQLPRHRQCLAASAPPRPLPGHHPGSREPRRRLGLLKDIGGRNVALPGPYYRASDDRACWDNPDTGDRLCVW